MPFRSFFIILSTFSTVKYKIYEERLNALMKKLLRHTKLMFSMNSRINNLKIHFLLFRLGVQVHPGLKQIKNHYIQCKSPFGHQLSPISNRVNISNDYTLW